MAEDYEARLDRLNKDLEDQQQHLGVPFKGGRVSSLQVKLY